MTPTAWRARPGRHPLHATPELSFEACIHYRLLPLLRHAPSPTAMPRTNGLLTRSAARRRLPPAARVPPCADFDLVRTSWTVIVRRTLGAVRTTCWSGSFPCIVYIDSSHRDTLRYEWSLIRCCHLVVCLVGLMSWIKECWLWLYLSWWLLYYFTHNVDICQRSSCLYML
jgi:hypothetical protein